MSSRRLEDLHPGARRRLQALIRWAAEAKRPGGGLDVFQTCTWRSNDEQARLYAQGRTAPGRIVTYARPGESWHNVISDHGFPMSRAFDLAWIKRDGKRVRVMYSFPAWFLDKAESLGLTCGARWEKFKDGPHFQYEFNNAGERVPLARGSEL